MKRLAPARPAFPFLGAAVCALSFAAYPPAVILAALGLISVHLATPAPEPIRVQSRAARYSRRDR